MAIQLVTVDVSEVKAMAAKFDLEFCGALRDCASDCINIPMDWKIAVDELPEYLKTPFKLAVVEFAVRVAMRTTGHLASIEKQFQRNAEKIIRKLYAWYNPMRYIAFAKAQVMAALMNDFIKASRSLEGYAHDLRYSDDWLNGIFKKTEKLRKEMDRPKPNAKSARQTEATIEVHVPPARKKAEQAKSRKTADKKPRAEANNKKNDARASAPKAEKGNGAKATTRQNNASKKQKATAQS